jgi:hypothetical protein
MANPNSDYSTVSAQRRARNRVAGRLGGLAANRKSESAIRRLYLEEILFAIKDPYFRNILPMHLKNRWGVKRVNMKHVEKNNDQVLAYMYRAIQDLARLDYMRRVFMRDMPVLCSFGGLAYQKKRKE